MDEIKSYDAKLDSIKLGMKYKAMHADAFAFFRATCHLYYAHFPKLGRLLQAPTAWSCGDLHLENFGVYRGDNGLVYFDLNDFDEALLAPCTFDAMRACASVAAAREKLALSAGDEADLMGLFVESYGKALAKGRARHIERDHASGVVGEMIGELRGASRQKLLDQRTRKEAGRRLIRIDGEHAMEASDREKARVAILLRRWAENNEDAQQRREGYFDIADVAVRIAGLGSLGLELYIVLLKGEGEPDEMRLIDIKRARPSCALEAARMRQPDWGSEAERVVEIQARMQTFPPAHLGAVNDRARSYVIRELQQREDRLDLATLAHDPERRRAAIKMFAQLTAWAQLRSAGRQGSAKADELIEYGHKTKWRDRLLLAAQHCAARSRADWEAFRRAFEAGAFRQGSSTRD